MNAIDDSLAIIVCGIFLFKYIANIIASEFATIIPKIAPKIKKSVEDGYCMLKEIDASCVLSPSSPINIATATAKIIFEEVMGEVSVCSFSSLKNDIIPIKMNDK